jgi:glycerate dehydrogenase
MSKIVFLDAFTANTSEINFGKFEKLGSFTAYDRTAPNLVVERANGAEILLTNKTILDANTISQLPNLKFIGVTATGYNIVDIKAARERGIIVSNVSGYSTASVAQQTIAMILAFSNRLAEHDNGNKWASQPDFCYYDYTLMELAGKTLGLVGFGEIAQKVARIALELGMNVLFTKNTPLDNPPFACTQTDLNALLSQSDFVSLHCPLTDANKGMINKSTLALMKISAYLINTARGPLINENDLKDALDSGTIAGAYLDVLSVEPPQKDAAILSAKNLKISPHIAWATLEARIRLFDLVLMNIENFLKGTPSNVIA